MVSAKQAAVRAKFKRALRECKGVSKSERKACFRRVFHKGG